MYFRSAISGLQSFRLWVIKLLAIARYKFFPFFKMMESGHHLWSCNSITTRSQGKPTYITKLITKSLSIVYFAFMRLVLSVLILKMSYRGYCMLLHAGGTACNFLQTNWDLQLLLNHWHQRNCGESFTSSFCGCTSHHGTMFLSVSFLLI